MSRCGHRLSGIHYSSAMKPMFTDKPANVFASEHRRNVTTPHGRPLGYSVLHLNCKRRPIGNGDGDGDGDGVVIYEPFLGTAWSLTFDDGESENRRGWTTSATFQDVASVREHFVKSRILAQRTRSGRTPIIEIQTTLRYHQMPIFNALSNYFPSGTVRYASNSSSSEIPRYIEKYA